MFNRIFMQSYTVKMQNGGRLTIPGAIRRLFNLKPGDLLELKASPGRIICTPQKIRLRQIEALKAATGAWADEDHPELKQGSAQYVRRLRREDERRFKQVTRQRSQK